MQNLLYSPPHANSTISDQVISTYSASQRRGLLCSEYPLDSKERTDNQLNSPFRLSNEDKSATKKNNDSSISLLDRGVFDRSEATSSWKSCLYLNSPFRGGGLDRCTSWPSMLFLFIFLGLFFVAKPSRRKVISVYNDSRKTTLGNVHLHSPQLAVSPGGLAEDGPMFRNVQTQTHQKKEWVGKHTG